MRGIAVTAFRSLYVLLPLGILNFSFPQIGPVSSSLFITPPGQSNLFLSTFPLEISKSFLDPSA